jgi:para-aminobenzoate synthetase/4-amino-4-deoxychorismate lyase
MASRSRKKCRMKIFFNFEKSSLYFDNPVSVVSCSSFENVPRSFEKIEKALAEGLYVAGFFSYELGYAFEDAFSSYSLNGFPLIYAGCYEKCQPYKNPLSITGHDCEIKNVRFNISKEEYFEHIELIRSYLLSGDVYQITYCLKILFDFNGSTFDLYKKLFHVQPVPYAAFIETEQYNMASLSPELFLNKRGNHIISKPMKGTWPRGNNLHADKLARHQFYYDEKNRAENVMITDLLRNDLGRVGKNISVPRLFEITPYKKLFQMTSTVAANIEPDIGLFNLFKSLFPSGSVTGAPKIHAMEIIHALEREPRNIYTGAIGYIKPDKDLFMNIPIRTALINRSSGQGEMGIGGGIVWDSTAEGEWEEGLLKARFFTDSI